jgi:hypothetical protein
MPSLKTSIPLLFGLVVGVLGGFMLGHASLPTVPAAEKSAYGVIQDYRKCSSEIPITRRRWPEARNAADVIAARNRVFNLLAAENDCAKISGIGGLSPSDIMGASGYAATSPLTLKLFPEPTR